MKTMNDFDKHILVKEEKREEKYLRKRDDGLRLDQSKVRRFLKALTG